MILAKSVSTECLRIFFPLMKLSSKQRFYSFCILDTVGPWKSDTVAVVMTGRKAFLSHQISTVLETTKVFSLSNIDREK